MHIPKGGGLRKYFAEVPNCWESRPQGVSLSLSLFCLCLFLLVFTGEAGSGQLNPPHASCVSQHGHLRLFCLRLFLPLPACNMSVLLSGLPAYEDPSKASKTAFRTLLQAAEDDQIQSQLSPSHGSWCMVAT